MASRRLSIYLNDHLAGSVAAHELARRSASSNRGTPLGEELERLAAELREDQSALRDIMRAERVGVDQKKAAAAWAGEKLGRLKLNGSWISYSPLSRLEELEILAVAVEGKRLLWEALAQRARLAPGEDGLDFDDLLGRARSQQGRLDRHRLEAVAEAL